MSTPEGPVQSNALLIDARAPGRASSGGATTDWDVTKAAAPGAPASKLTAPLRAYYREQTERVAYDGVATNAAVDVVVTRSLILVTGELDPAGVVTGDRLTIDPDGPRSAIFATVAGVDRKQYGGVGARLSTTTLTLELA